MDPAWQSAIVFLGVATVIAGGALLGARLLRVVARSSPPTKLDTYECGEEPEGIAWVRFHPRYYVVALLFVLFDVETVFILPWALNLDDLGVVALVQMVVFVGVLLLGWAYAVRKGVVQWL